MYAKRIKLSELWDPPLESMLYYVIIPEITVIVSHIIENSDVSIIIFRDFLVV